MKFLGIKWESKKDRIAALEQSCEQYEASIRELAAQVKAANAEALTQRNEAMRLSAELKICGQVNREQAGEILTLKAQRSLQGLNAKEWEAAEPSKTDVEVMAALKGVSAENGILKAVRGLLEAEREACAETAMDARIGEREERHCSGGAHYLANVLARLRLLHAQAQGDRQVIPVRKGRQRVSGRP